MGVFIVEVVGKRAIVIALCISVFAGKNARGAGAEHHRDPFCTIAYACGIHGFSKAVGPQCDVGKAIVAAIEPPKRVRKAIILQSVNPSDMAARGLPEVAGPEPGPPRL